MFSLDDLLDKNYIIENEFYIKYVNLIKDNLIRCKEKYKTQKHHIIPKCYFIYENIQIDDSKMNTVNLLYKDHILAHFYLAQCAINLRFKYANISAIEHLIGSRYHDKQEYRNFLNNLDLYQDLYEFYKQNLRVYKSCKGVNQGKVFITNGTINKRVYKEHLDNYLNNGFRLGITHTIKEKKKTINNGYKELIVPESQLQGYLNLGWQLGRCERIRQQMSNINIGRKHAPTTLNKKAIKKDACTKFVEQSQLQEYLDTGWELGIYDHENMVREKLSDDVKQKISLSQKDRVWINKDFINKKIKYDQLDNYLNLGWQLGRYDDGRQKYAFKEKHRWLHKGNQNVLVVESEINKYIDDGYIFGRDNYKTHDTRKLIHKSKKGINKGGKYLHKDGVKKHFYGEEIDIKLNEGWQFCKK